MGLSYSRCSEEQGSAVEEAQKSALVKSSSVDDLRFKDTLPHRDYIQRLVKDFCQSSSSERMRRVIFSPGKAFRENVSASYHLPGARTPILRVVFHFANLHTPNLRATVKFTMPADYPLMMETSGCCVEVEFTKGCPKAPIAVDHSPRVALHIATDVFIEALRFLPRHELEKMMLMSRRWSNIIAWAAGTFQQRRGFYVFIKFYGRSVGMLTVYFFRRLGSAQPRFLRLVTAYSLSQTLNAVRSHLRNAYVQRVVPVFRERIPAPHPPFEMLVDIPFPARIEWLKSLLRSMPPNSEIGSLFVSNANIETDNLLTVTTCALEQHTKLACVQELYLGLFYRDATWARLSSILNEPCTRAFSDISVSTTRVAIDTTELRALLSSWQLQKLRIYVEGGIEPQDDIKTLPAQIIRDFLALRDVQSFTVEFSLLLQRRDNIAFAEISDVDEATDRRKRFRFRIRGEDTVVRVSVYKNRAARELLTVVTFDHFRRTVLFLKGNVSLADLKLSFQRLYGFY